MTPRKRCALMPACLILWIALCLPLPGRAESACFIKSDPTKTLSRDFPPAQGWSCEKLCQALFYAQDAGATAVIILHKGHLVAEWGVTDRRNWSHSTRKSLLSALYGIAVDKGLIDMSATLGKLGIDDRPPCLTPEEKKAAVADLIKARSGVYHPAAAESEGMKKARPSRGSHAPGTFWYYNNWDFNVLGTIFERKTNLSIGRAFREWIAEPIGMVDFRARDVFYRWETSSLHPAYPFYVTPRDMARFSQLYLQQGKWKDRQVIPASWIQESTKSYSETGSGGYGYMWWIHHTGAYFASGNHGQFFLVAPEEELVVVNMVFTGTPAMNKFPSNVARNLREEMINPVTGEEFTRLMEMIVEAAPFGREE